MGFARIGSTLGSDPSASPASASSGNDEVPFPRSVGYASSETSPVSISSRNSSSFRIITPCWRAFSVLAGPAFGPQHKTLSFFVTAGLTNIPAPTASAARSAFAAAEKPVKQTSSVPAGGIPPATFSWWRIRGTIMLQPFVDVRFWTQKLQDAIEAERS